MAEVPELAAALCVRFGEESGPLAPGGSARAAADAVITALRGGADDTTLEPLFRDLEAALVRAGLPHGLGTGGFRTDQPGRYRPLPGTQARAVHVVLRCPADRPCARLERGTRVARAEPPLCSVHGTSLQEERLRR